MYPSLLRMILLASLRMTSIGEWSAALIACEMMFPMVFASNVFHSSVTHCDMQSLLKISLKLHNDAIKSLDPAWRHADAINSRFQIALVFCGRDDN